MTTAETNKTRLSMIYEEIADFLLSSPTTDQIADYHLSEGADQYISELLEANRTRGLTPEEHAALDDYSHIEHFMQIVKIRAYAKLDAAKRNKE